MKKRFTLIISILLLTGCSSIPKTGETNTITPSSEIKQTQAVNTEAPLDETKCDFDTFSVEILDAAFSTDYEGKKIIVINANYTNKSDDSKAFLWQSQVQAFQNGIELDTAIVLNDSIYDAGLAQKEIKKDVQLKVQSAFVLQDDSPVEVEIGELIAFGNKKLAKKTYTVQ